MHSISGKRIMWRSESSHIHPQAEPLPRDMTRLFSERLSARTQKLIE